MKTPYFHVHGIKYEDGDRSAGERMIVQECEDDDPALTDFGLYTRNDEGYPVWISDHETRAEAIAAGIAAGMTEE